MPRLRGKPNRSLAVNTMLRLVRRAPGSGRVIPITTRCRCHIHRKHCKHRAWACYWRGANEKTVPIACAETINTGGTNGTMAIKAKNMMYTQQVQYMHFSDIDELEKQIKKNIKPKRYALILHDKDTNEQGLKVNEHVHVVLEFENARSLNNIAGLLKDNPQYIEKWDSKVKNAYSYLIHATDTAQDQWQYDVDEVRANFDYAELIKTMRSSRKKKKSLRQQKIDALLDMLYDGSITKHEIERSLSGSE